MKFRNPFRWSVIAFDNGTYGVTRGFAWFTQYLDVSGSDVWTTTYGSLIEEFCQFPSEQSARAALDWFDDNE